MLEILGEKSTELGYLKYQLVILSEVGTLSDKYNCKFLGNNTVISHNYSALLHKGSYSFH